MGMRASGRDTSATPSMIVNRLVGALLATGHSTLPRLCSALVALSVAVALTASCGGSGESSGASTGPTSPSATPGYKWSVSGSVVDTVAHQSVPGATVKPSWNLPAVSASGDGSYSLGSTGNPPANPSKVIVSADGFVPHEQWVPVRADQRTDMTLDLIRNAAPFSMDYYRQLVRGTFDQEGAPYDVLRWEQTPKFYIKTTDQLNRAIAADVINVIRDGVARAVPAWTGGQYSAIVESGKDLRLPTPGWVNIMITTDPGEHVTCGQSYIGRDPGEINLVINPVCSCGAIKIPGLVVVHEVGHALGFFHVSDKRSVMYPAVTGSCPVGEPSAEELYHAAIAYQRPRGNSDPDIDPSATRSFGARRVHAPAEKVKN
jgi:hypothetical protein